MIASGAPAWAVWLALGLWGVAIILAAVTVAYARRTWRRLQPTLAPLLAMFMPSSAAAEAELLRQLGPEDERPGALAGDA